MNERNQLQLMSAHGVLRHGDFDHDEIEFKKIKTRKHIDGCEVAELREISEFSTRAEFTLIGSRTLCYSPLGGRAKLGFPRHDASLWIMTASADEGQWSQDCRNRC